MSFYCARRSLCRGENGAVKIGEEKAYRWRGVRGGMAVRREQWR